MSFEGQHYIQSVTLGMELIRGMIFTSKLTKGKGATVLFVMTLSLSVIAFISAKVYAENHLIQAKELSEILSKIAKEGQVRVIVGLKLPPPGFIPEGALSNPEVVRRQRDAIAGVREALFNRLGVHEITVYAVYKSIPYVAMGVGADALRELVISPDVISIHEDTPKGLYKTGNPAQNDARDLKNKPTIED